MQLNSVDYILFKPEPLVRADGKRGWIFVGVTDTPDACVAMAAQMKLTEFAIRLSVCIAVAQIERGLPEGNVSNINGH